MSDLFDRRGVPIHEQVECAERELGYRRRVYPRWVSDGRMTQAKADLEIARMEAIVKTLREIPA